MALFFLTVLTDRGESGLEAVQKVPELRDARQAKLVPAEAGIQSHNEAYFLYVE